MASKFQFILAHFAITNDFISTQDKTLYYSANLGATLYLENLLADTFFKPKTSTPLKNVNFDQWKQVKESGAGQTQDNPPSSNAAPPSPSTPASALSKLKQETQNAETPEPSETETEPIGLDSLMTVTALENAKGFKDLPIKVTGEVVAFGQRSGAGLTPSSSFELGPIALQHIFKTDETNPNFRDTSAYTNNGAQRPFSSETDAQGDAQFARIHSPTFYLKFLLDQSSQFPIVLLARGSVQKANGLAVVLHHDARGSSLTVNGDSTFFRAIVFFSDNKGKMFNFETDFIFQTGMTHSLSLTVFQFFGQFAQFVLTFDDASYFKSSSVIRNIVFDNTPETLRIFPKDKSLFDALSSELTAASGSSPAPQTTPGSVNSPGLGSILFRLTLLNSAAGLLSNVVFGNSLDFLKNCLSTCPLSFSFRPLQSLDAGGSDASLDMLLKPVGYSSEACLTCTSLNSTFNMASSSQSLYPSRPNWTLSNSRQQKSTS